MLTVLVLPQDLLGSLHLQGDLMGAAHREYVCDEPVPGRLGGGPPATVGGGPRYDRFEVQMFSRLVVLTPTVARVDEMPSAQMADSTEARMTTGLQGHLLALERQPLRLIQQ
jgi:hypothetical protein